MRCVGGLSWVLAGMAALSGCGDGVFRRSDERKLTPADEPVCQHGDVQRIDVPLYYDGTEDQGAPLSYAFQYIPAASADLPTVVHIPGGPGQTSIGDQAAWESTVPEGYGLVLTDPRGVGCNFREVDGLGAEFFRSEHVARDVLSAVQDLQLTNYTLYGISYGTVVATMAASIAEAGDWPKPRSVVLEGVLGRTFVGDESNATYTKLLDEKMAKLKEEAGPAAVAAFKQEPLPLGKTADEWLAVLRTTLMIGGGVTEDGTPGDWTYTLLKRAVSTDPREQESALGIFNLLDEDILGNELGTAYFYAFVACREIFPDLRSVEFSGGTFRWFGEDACAKAQLAIDRPYDAADWPVKAPIYYLTGRDDPATPLVLARHHFAASANSPGRQLLIVNEGGHNPLAFSMGDCKAPVWDAMTSNTGFATAVATCRWPLGFDLSTIEDGRPTLTAIGGVPGAGLRLAAPAASDAELVPLRLRSILAR